jgi:hypothetical protein
MMRVLVACEFSGRVREAFKAKGHDAWSCDLLPTEIPGQHIQDDVLKHLTDGWDLMIAHPPCTYLCNSGVRWLTIKSSIKEFAGCLDKSRHASMIEACNFFNNLLFAPIPKIAVENPIQHKYARNYIRHYDQIIQPYNFGEPESKATCLWLKNLPPLMSTLKHTIVNQSTFREPPSPDRWKNRSRTFQGIANAMAKQWG